jgi:hypothetical protein
MQENQGFVRVASQTVAHRSIRISEQVIDSAALVFAHTILDGTLSDCCSISFEAEPADWFQFVKNRKVEIDELLKSSAKDIGREEALQFVNQQKRESIIKRLNLLNSVCIPRLKGEKSATSWIKQDQLEAFDQLRHRLIREQAFAEKFTGVEDQVLFAGLVGLSALWLVGKAYGLRADGLLDKDNRDKEAILSQIYSGAFRQFPELEEQLNRMTNALTSILNETQSNGDHKPAVDLTGLKRDLSSLLSAHSG